ncbi:membrane protein insertion efficiency factor YidD [Sorangium sp. So ce590]|uniref:membrane protein insertion efficiency factor YidD n=1 Tax=unclassified Sorangium TaxID=2621164 RepID=UPI003F632896
MLAKLLLALIRAYQMTLSRVIVALMGPVCRFEPSCSRYAAACILGHGALRGSLLSLKRLCRCHPFHPGGFDPPPPPRLPRDAAARTPTQRDVDPRDTARCSATGTELASHASPPRRAGFSGRVTLMD